MNNEKIITFKVKGSPPLIKSFLKEYSLFTKKNQHLAYLARRMASQGVNPPPPALPKNSFVSFFVDFLEIQYCQSNRGKKSPLLAN